jgi:hypothetical protein
MQGGTMIGTLLQERYRIDARLGRWCGTEVYRAMDMQRQQPVLVRLLSSALASNESLWSQLVVRAQQLAAILHPGLLPLLSLGRENGMAYLVQAYAQARPLSEVWRPESGPLSPEQALMFVRQLGDALESMHRAGLVHGALCPDSVLIDENTGNLLLDGMAAAPLQGAEESVRAAAAAYAAPEQISMATATPAGDRYALGALAFEWLTGQPPRGATGPAMGGVEALSWGQQALAQPPSASALNPALSPAVDRAFAELLHPNPSGRPQSATAVAERLAQGLRGRAGARRGRTPAWVWSVLGGVVAVLLVTGGLWAILSKGGLDALAGRIVGRGASGWSQRTPTAWPTTPAAVFPTATPGAALPTETLAPTGEPTAATTEPTATDTPAPTNTPQPTATATPTLTSTPTKTPGPSPTPLACGLPVEGPFAALWATHQADLGCPLQAAPVAGFWAEEPFDNGHMYWSEDGNVFVVLMGIDGGTWAAIPDDESAWQEGMPAKSCDPDKPDNRELPVRGFGYIWCNNEAIRTALGWATDKEQGFEGGVLLLHPFENGYILRDSDGYGSNRAYVLSGATFTFFRTTY